MGFRVVWQWQPSTVSNSDNCGGLSDSQTWLAVGITQTVSTSTRSSGKHCSPNVNKFKFQLKAEKIRASKASDLEDKKPPYAKTLEPGVETDDRRRVVAPNPSHTTRTIMRWDQMLITDNTWDSVCIASAWNWYFYTESKDVLDFEVHYYATRVPQRGNVHSLFAGTPSCLSRTHTWVAKAPRITQDVVQKSTDKTCRWWSHEVPSSYQACECKSLETTVSDGRWVVRESLLHNKTSVWVNVWSWKPQ